MATPVCRNPQEEEADDEAKTEEEPMSPGLEHMMFYHNLLLALENQKKKVPFCKDNHLTEPKCHHLAALPL